MAERRMFSKKITDSDAFISLPSSAQALYFHLNQGADDDGFNNQIQLAMMKAHASSDDVNVLLLKKFIIQFQSGVVVVKHWWIHNTLRKDRYSPTVFQDEIKLLGQKENNAYTLSKEKMVRLPFGCQMVAPSEGNLKEISLNNNNNLKEGVIEEREKESMRGKEGEPDPPTQGFDLLEEPKKEEESVQNISNLTDNSKFEAFQKKYKIVTNNYNSGVFGEIDWELLDKRYSESNWLQQSGRTLSFICKHYAEIKEGVYKDAIRGSPNKGKQSNLEKAQWMIEKFRQEKKNGT